MPVNKERMEEKKKVLLIFQENIFNKSTNYNIDFVTTGYSFTPLSEKNGNSWNTILKVAARLLTKHYDVIFLPTPNVDFEWDKSSTKRRIRHSVKWLLKTRVFRFIVKKMVANRRVIVLDRFYYSSVQYDFWNLFGSDSDYYTTNLSVAAHSTFNNKAVYPNVGYVHQFPLYIDTEKYPLQVSAAKDIDLFFSGAINSPSREKALSALNQLKSMGYNVVVNTDRLNIREYMGFMERSLLCLSPAGLGYDCFRHYEIMLAGSVPLINAPDHPLMIELHDGENCFIYDDPQHLVDKSIELLGKRQFLIELGNQLRENVRATNDINSIGTALLNRYVSNVKSKRTESAFTGMLKYSSYQRPRQQA